MLKNIRFYDASIYLIKIYNVNTLFAKEYYLIITK